MGGRIRYTSVIKNKNTRNTNTMIELLIALLINSLYICGLHIATSEGYILSAVNNIALPQWVKNPLFACVTCMASLHSIPFFIYFDYSLELWPFYALALAAINTGLYGFIDRVSK